MRMRSLRVVVCARVCGLQVCLCLPSTFKYVIAYGPSRKVENNFLTDRGLEVIAGKLYTDLTRVESTEQRVRVVGGKRHENYDPNLLSESVFSRHVRTGSACTVASEKFGPNKRTKLGLRNRICFGSMIQFE